jgi:uncharacterized coiled-coil protein SlyX
MENKNEIINLLQQKIAYLEEEISAQDSLIKTAKEVVALQEKCINVLKQKRFKNE